MKNIINNKKNEIKSYNPKAHTPAAYIPCWLIQIPAAQLSERAKLLYGRLAQWSSTKGTVHRSVRQLSEEIGVSSDCVERTLKELRDVKLIETYRVKSGGVNHYRFLDHDWIYKPINENLEYRGNLSEDIPPSITPDTPPAGLRVPTRKNAVPKIKRNINTNINTTTTIEVDRKKTPKSSSSFVIDERTDANLLQLRDEHLEGDDRTDEEFLKQCNHHLDNGNKAKYNFARRLKGLKKIISLGLFEMPAGYGENKIVKSKFSPEQEELMATYRHAKWIESCGGNFEDFMPDKAKVKKAKELLKISKRCK
jgi:DNA-binding transcriptional ArsR family regulator